MEATCIVDGRRSGSEVDNVIGTTWLLVDSQTWSPSQNLNINNNVHMIFLVHCQWRRQH